MCIFMLASEVEFHSESTTTQNAVIFRTSKSLLHFTIVMVICIHITQVFKKKNFKFLYRKKSQQVSSGGGFGGQHPILCLLKPINNSIQVIRLKFMLGLLGYAIFCHVACHSNLHNK